jgi:feruloyl esterase
MVTLRGRIHLGGLLLITIALVAALPAGSARAKVLSCDVATIQSVSPADTTITSAEMKTVLVPYCDVIGAIATSTSGQNNTVIFELGLPDAWAGSFLFWGNGGFAGSLQAVDDGTFDFLLTFGFAVAATDTGHESSAGFYGFLDGSFGLSGGQPALAAREDFGYRAVHLSTVASQTIVQAYYAPTYNIYYASFFDGCSTGGRQALVEAQKFPNDYRAIVAGDPRYF